MFQSFKYSPYLRLRWLVVVLVLMVTPSCSKLSPLSLLTGSGPNVAANTQVGKENYQTVGVTNAVRPQLRVEAPVEQVVQDTSTTNNTNTSIVVLLLLILGWVLPTPNQIAQSFVGLFIRKH